MLPISKLGIVARFEVAAYLQCVIFLLLILSICVTGGYRLFEIQCLHIPVRDRTPFLGNYMFSMLEITFHFIRPLKFSPQLYLVERI